MACVYRHIRLDTNEPFYIGISSNNKRPYCKHSRNSKWNEIVSLTEYEVEIIIDDISVELANKKEIEFIELYGKSILNNGPLCNISDGGKSKLTGFSKVLSEETKKKISRKLKGKNSPMYGVKKSDAVKKKIMLSKCKRVIDTVTKKIYLNGKIASLETDYSYRQIHRFLTNQYPNKTNMMYLDNYKKHKLCQ